MLAGLGDPSGMSFSLCTATPPSGVLTRSSPIPYSDFNITVFMIFLDLSSKALGFFLATEDDDTGAGGVDGVVADAEGATTTVVEAGAVVDFPADASDVAFAGCVSLRLLAPLLTRLQFNHYPHNSLKIFILNLPFIFDL